MLRNKTLFMKIKEKQVFKMVQIMMLKNIEAFTNEDILTFLDILGDPSFLITSMNNHIQDIRFTVIQLQHY